MRILLLTTFGFILLGISLTLNKSPKHFYTYQEVLKEMMEEAPLKTYHNDFYGYTIQYPEMFRWETKASEIDKGFIRLGYHNQERLVIECNVLCDSKETPIAEKMQELATQMRASEQIALRDSFILSGPVYENGNLVEGYRYHCKFVRCQKLWFSYALYYPTHCTDSVQRIIRQIDEWEALEKQHLPILPTA